MAESGRALLAYQPFYISNTLLTGVGSSWLHQSEPGPAKLVFDRLADGFEAWSKGLIGYQALTACYQAFLDVIVAACPGGSYLDLPCNTGWFPVAASMRGMTPSVGIDVEDYGPAMFYLNTFTGATARFVRSRWESQQRQFHPAIEGRFDVVSCMAFLVHLPDPLQFLAALADLSDHAVFLWAAFLRSDERLIRYGLADQFFGEPFPWCYDAGTAISDALLVEAMQRLGFPNWTEVTTRAGVWPAEWDNALMKPFQPMRAFLFTRS